ncbi:M20/M25/M40 family metallo-hydrolase [Sphingomonas sp. Leaf4]|uniref:M20/M25/M40 family metallo-hydrolase n=1 Tax=Sphingomonas sp. Leaf4 TaxID=2876553 RepID=UPI001E4ACB3F|nr:M20/M25/M40 family metallo-hydrolase [Sphingomonas sp. Leaf4]
MSLRPILGLAAGLLAATSAFAQTITPQMLRDHVAVLASDAYEGREPGTPGGDRAEAYVLQAFAAAGLQPGAPDGRWRQEVAMTDVRAATIAGTVTRSGKPVALGANQIAGLGLAPTTSITRAPLVFVGRGAPDQMAGTDLTGAVAVVIGGTAPDAPPVPNADRNAALQAAGALGVLLIASAQAPWADVAHSFSELTIAGPVRRPGFTGVVSPDAAQLLLGRSAADLRTAAIVPTFRPVRSDATIDIAATGTARRYTTANIVGMLPGTQRPNEAVLLSAHWDHIGICAPEGAADRICNGAADNASGTAILIEVAKVLAKQPRSPRSVYFVATTAEEKGLIGADAYAAAIADTPLKVVVNLNIDTSAIVPVGMPMAMVGRGNHPAIDAIVDQTARAIGRKVDTDIEANIMVQRQDGWAFGQRGIPAVMATGSVSDMKRLFAYLDGPYHKPTDDMAHIDLTGAAEDADLHVALARALADPARYPTPAAPAQPTK